MILIRPRKAGAALEQAGIRLGSKRRPRAVSRRPGWGDVPGDVGRVPHDHIAIDNLAASHVAVQHLVSLDRRRIAFVGAHTDVNRQPAHLRLSGYRDALATAGLPVDPSLVATAAQFGRHDGLVEDGLVEDGRFSNPILTTISPDKDHIGRLAVRSLVARVEGKAVDPPRDVQPPFRLVTRESTLGRR